jgi:AraC-like DNA-binding protein
MLQPKLEKVFPNLASSIFVKREVVPYMDYPWHYHPEFEIIFVEKSYGIRLMGNHVGNFSDGDLMFIGPNLPHVWKNDVDFYKENKDLMVDVYVIQFREEALGKGFFDIPEFTLIKKLFLLGQQGFLIKGEDQREISELIKKVYSSSGIDRLIMFFKTLDAISKSKDYDLLSSPGYTNSVNISDTERINKVMNYLMENYNKEFNLKEIADLVSLNISSFCRYFRSRTHKTCSQFINEIRIAHACKLLINRNMTITEICYETGYNNISHFNRQFKLITSMTAREYEKKYLKNATLVEADLI